MADFRPIFRINRDSMREGVKKRNDSEIENCTNRILEAVENQLGKDIWSESSHHSTIKKTISEIEDY